MAGLRGITSCAGVEVQAASCSLVNQSARRRDALPECAGGTLIHTSSGVVVGDHLDLAILQTKSGHPFPNIPAQVKNTIRAIVMRPGDRAATRGNSAIGGRASISVCNHAMLMGVGVVLAIAGIATGQKAILLAPQGNRGPFRIGQQMPALALVLAIGLGLVDIDIGAGVLPRQAISPVTLHDVLILTHEDLRHLHAVDDEGRVGSI